MWTWVPHEWTREVGTFEMRGHMTFGPGHPNFLGPGCVDPGVWTRVPPGLPPPPEVGTFEMRGHMTFGFMHSNFLGPGYPLGRSMRSGVTSWTRVQPPGQVWTCRLNPKSLGVKHICPKLIHGCSKFCVFLGRDFQKSRSRVQHFRVQTLSPGSSDSKMPI